MLARFRSATKKLSPGLRKILGNVGWLFVERALAMVAAFSIGIFVIKYLGSESFGKLSYSISFVALFGVIAQLGLNQIVVCEIVREEKATPEILGTTFAFKLLASLITMILVGITIENFPNESSTRSMIWILSISLLFTAFDSIEFWFQSQVLSGVLAILRSVQLIVSSLVKLLFIFLQLPLVAFVWLILIEQFLRSLGILWLYFTYNRSIAKWNVNWSRGIRMIENSWPLILSGVMVTIYMKIDQVMLGNMVDSRSVGNYAAAVRFSEIWYFIPMAVCSSVFPAILQAKQKNREQYYSRLQQLYDLMAWISLAIAIPITFLSKPLILTLLGKEYVEASTILAWHIWASPFVFLGVARSQWLIAENLTRFSLFTTCLGAIVNVCLNFLLIPSYKGVGAAIATTISYAIAGYITCFIYPPLLSTAFMLTKALFVPFRFRQNLIYISHVKTLFCNS